MIDWNDKIKAFLHDPPDKALRIKDHESRRDKLLKVLGLNFDLPPEFDWIASSMERIVPKTDVWIDFSRKGIQPILKHPITGKEKKYVELSECIKGVKKSRIERVIEYSTKVEENELDILKDDDPKKTYFRVWRYLKECIENSAGSEIANLPADTRCPDHTIWDHLDASSAIYGAMAKGKPALLMFKISPVQDFIKNARKEKDLWAGSHLLSFLTFQAMKVIVDRFGPDAVIFPHLRGQPFFDFNVEYYEYFKDLLNERWLGNPKDKLKIANIPNKFLAIVSMDDSKDLENKIREKINETLGDLAQYSLKIFNLNDEERKICLKAVENYFNITVQTIPADMDMLIKIIDDLPNNKKYENWISLLKTFGYKLRDFDLYSLMFELIEEIVALESRKFSKAMGKNKKKCTMCGELEIVGSERMWRKFTNKLRETGLIKEKEMLCPICLIKRFYPIWFSDRYSIDAGFESVSEVALRKKEWLKKVKDSKEYREFVEFIKSSTLKDLIEDKNENLKDFELLYVENWNDKYLRENFGVRCEESEIEKVKEILRLLYYEHGEPEKYYAILIMDGDDMGRMLIGDEMRPVEEYLHPEVLNRLPNGVKERIKETRRLITPATHSAISRALAYFSIKKVPNIVKNHGGELIYAGGDDVLALLPIDSALACAYRIQKKFGKEWDGWNLLPAKTMSAGILIVHYKHPLYDALDKARGLEKKAKESGRNAVAIGYLARSGSYDEVVFNWSLVEKLTESLTGYHILDLIIRSKQKERVPPYISERLSYDVLSEIDNLPNDVGAIAQFLKYELSRHYHDNDKDRKKRVLERLVSSVIECARRIRVTLSKDELDGTLGCKLKKSDVRKVNDLIKCIVKECGDECPDVRDLLRFGVSNDEKIKGLEELLGISNDKIYRELEGLILKKQIKGFFILLKILVDCDADLGGVSCEDNN